jgi:hypothetical protein
MKNEIMDPVGNGIADHCVCGERPEVKSYYLGCGDSRCEIVCPSCGFSSYLCDEQIDAIISWNIIVREERRRAVKEEPHCNVSSTVMALATLAAIALFAAVMAMIGK